MEPQDEQNLVAAKPATAPVVQVAAKPVVQVAAKPVVQVAAKPAPSPVVQVAAKPATAPVVQVAAGTARRGRGRPRGRPAGGWTSEEDKVLIDEQEKVGNNWAEITKLLPGRTEVAVSRRWYQTMKRMYEEGAGGSRSQGGQGSRSLKQQKTSGGGAAGGQETQVKVEEGWRTERTEIQPFFPSCPLRHPLSMDISVEEVLANYCVPMRAFNEGHIHCVFRQAYLETDLKEWLRTEFKALMAKFSGHWRVHGVLYPSGTRTTAHFDATRAVRIIQLYTTGENSAKYFFSGLHSFVQQGLSGKFEPDEAGVVYRDGVGIRVEHGCAQAFSSACRGVLRSQKITVLRSCATGTGNFHSKSGPQWSSLSEVCH